MRPVSNSEQDVSVTDGAVNLKCNACKSKGRRTFAMVHTRRAFNGRPVTSQYVELDDKLYSVMDQYALARILHMPCPQCGSSNVQVNVVKGTYVADKSCGARCMGATGPTCECTCAGRNHGGNNAIW